MTRNKTQNFEKMTDITIAVNDGNQDVLDVCQNIKLLCAKLHHFYAELFKDDRTSLLLWKRTAMEEENNAKEFALITTGRIIEIRGSVLALPEGKGRAVAVFPSSRRFPRESRSGPAPGARPRSDSPTGRRSTSIAARKRPFPRPRNNARRR